MIAPRCTSRLAANSTDPTSAAAIASASDPPSASQVIGPITTDRVPNPPYSTAKAIRAQFLPWRSWAARYASQVKASSRIPTPTSTSAAEPTYPVVASITTRVVSNRPAATAMSHSQKEARSCIGSLAAAGNDHDIAFWPGRPDSYNLLAVTSDVGSPWRLGAVMPLTFIDWHPRFHRANRPIRDRVIPTGSRHRILHDTASRMAVDPSLREEQSQHCGDSFRLAVGLC